MKKASLFLFFLFILNTFALAKVALGITGGVDLRIKAEPESHVTSGISVRSDMSPWGLEAHWNFNERSLALFLDDWWICKRLNSMLNFYTFWGLSFGLKFENEFYAQTGPRLGLGIDVFLFKNRSLEFYVQGAWNPSLGMNYDRDDEKYSFRFVPSSFPVNSGIRFWF